MNKKYIAITLISIFVACSNKETIKTYYPDGTLQAVCTLINGKREGEHRQYYSTGELELVTHFKNDEQYGEVKQYYKSGNILSKGFRINGLLEGESQDFYPSGQLKSVVNYQNDLLHGSFTSYYPTGVIQTTGSYVYGKGFNDFHYYSKTGRLDSLVQIILIDTTKYTNDVFRDEYLTKDMIDTRVTFRNMVVRYEGDSVDFENSLFANVEINDSVPTAKDSIAFTIFFSNPWVRYAYNSDSIEFHIFVDNDFSHAQIINISSKIPIRLTTFRKKIDSNYVFKAFIQLKYDDGESRNIYIKESFSPSDWEHL